MSMLLASMIAHLRDNRVIRVPSHRISRRFRGAYWPPWTVSNFTREGGICRRVGAGHWTKSDGTDSGDGATYLIARGSLARFKLHCFDAPFVVSGTR